MQKHSKPVQVLAIWASITSLMFFMLVSINFFGIETILGPMVIFATFALFLAYYIVQGLTAEPRNASPTQQSTNMPPNHQGIGGTQGESRIDLLLRLMTEDEREALKESLLQKITSEQQLGDDGEFWMDNRDLESLFYPDEKRKNTHEY